MTVNDVVFYLQERGFYIGYRTVHKLMYSNAIWSFELPSTGKRVRLQTTVQDVEQWITAEKTKREKKVAAERKLALEQERYQREVQAALLNAKIKEDVRAITQKFGIDAPAETATADYADMNELADKQFALIAERKAKREERRKAKAAKTK